MWLAIENLHTRVMRATDEERRWLANYLSFKDQRFGRKGNVVQLFNQLADSFPTGFAPLVVKNARKDGIVVEFADKRVRPAAPMPILATGDAAADEAANRLGADLGWLRDYQLEAVRTIHQRGRGLLWLPTGAGKTEIAVGLVQSIPCRWLFLVHRSTLLAQTAERYTLRTGLQAGSVGAGVFNPDARFTVATFQTLHAKLETPEVAGLLDSVEGVIVDEAHTLPADSFWRVVMKMRNAYYRVGVSGTPLARGDQRSQLTIAALGPVLYRIRAQLLQDRGVLSKPHIRMVPVYGTSQAKTWAGVYSEAVVKSKRRNRAIFEAVKKAAKPCMVFVQHVDHGKALARGFNLNGINTEFVWGQKDLAQRQGSVRRLLHGDIDVLVCSVIFQEGVDIPSLRSVVIASGGKSVIAALQRIGRGMRVDKATGKTEFEVYDIDDRGCGCRPGDDERHRACNWLEQHTKKRLKAYASEGFEVTITDPPVNAKGQGGLFGVRSP